MALQRSTFTSSFGDGQPHGSPLRGKNVLAAGRCQLRTRGRDVVLVEPEVVIDRELRFIPRAGRVIERWNGVTEVVRMRAV